jgi:hypothetical protein
MNQERILKLLAAQERSARLWIQEFESHRDAPSIRNVMFALGKWFGIFNILLDELGGEDAPPEVFEMAARLQKVYDEAARIPIRNYERPQ